MLMAALFGTLILMIMLGFPIYMCLIGASALYMLLAGNLSPLIAVQRVLIAPDSFALLAVPFFILAGQIMNSGGVTTRIFRFSRCVIGHFRGGLGYVNIVASIIFSGMSGSALADAGGLGQVEIKAMRDAGYDDDFSLGVTAASSTVGPLIPPSIAFVIYGAMANVSIGGLFVGGIVPGLMVGLTLSVMVFFVARKRNYPVHPRVPLRETLVSFKDSILSLLMPLIILGGIWAGVFTPTEAALVSILYALIVTGLIYRELSFKQLPGMMIDTIRMVAPAILIVGGANLFGWIMNFHRLDRILVDLLLGISTNRFVILMIINLILLFMGMFLEVISAIMLMLPILGPLVLQVGLDPIHLGVVMVLNLMIGLLTPPVGFVLYVLSSTTNNPIKMVIRSVTPWLIPLLATLLLITRFPELVLFLPRVMGFTS